MNKKNLTKSIDNLNQLKQKIDKMNGGSGGDVTELEEELNALKSNLYLFDLTDVPNETVEGVTTYTLDLSNIEHMKMYRKLSMFLGHLEEDGEQEFEYNLPCFYGKLNNDNTFVFNLVYISKETDTTQNELSPIITNTYSCDLQSDTLYPDNYGVGTFEIVETIDMAQDTITVQIIFSGLEGSE